VTRIIAGTARGRRIRVPSGGARPTTDRVREALFASLDHLLGGFSGLRVLDLYAGSGALGLEAASRGAGEVVLVERDRPTAAAARANATSVDLPGVQVVVAPVLGYLSGAAGPFDLVLADPPYATPAPEVEAVLERLAGGWLAPGAVIVVERPTRDGEFSWPTGFVAHRQSAYGGTTLWYGRYAPEGEDR
jgi:16S rRNA (guanine966-N2)-methyltransferase